MREEIRGGIHHIIYDPWDKGLAGSTDYSRKCADRILSFLHSKGVVIETKPDWCPAHGYPLPCCKCGAPKGITVYEPLIGDE